MPVPNARPVPASPARNVRPLRRRGVGAGDPALDGVAPLPFVVVESKVAVPSLRAGMVPRTALVNRLRATAHPIVVLTAPAGYGKSTVLAQWAARDSRPFAWLSVDIRDNDPILLLRHLALALHRIEPLSAAVLKTLSAPAPSIWGSIVPRLGSALAAFTRPVVIVLDDAHVLLSRAVIDAVCAIAQHGADGSLVVLAGRAPPRFGGAKLRANGELAEVGVDLLAMTPNESRLLLRATDVDLSPEAEEELIERCEGWPAALYLAVLALRADERAGVDPSGPFGGEDRNFADYIRAEYLAQLKPGALRFLRRTSVLGRMCGSLCDAVLDVHGSTRELQKIERSNLFLVPLDHTRTWYRYQHLFRDLLQRELAEREPQLFTVLHSRAADWYQRHDDPESALEHALAAGQLDRVARIVTAIALPAYYDGRIAPVERWLAHFDDPALLARYPGVALQGAWVHALAGRAADSERWLEAAEGGTFKGKLPDGCTSLDPWISTLRAALCREGVEQMLADAESGLAGLPPDSLLRPTALLVLGSAHVLLGATERGDDFLKAAADSAARVGATDTRMIAISERSLLASADDDPHVAQAFALQVQEVLDDGRLDGYLTSAIALAVAARAALRYGRWDEAQAHLAKAEQLRPLLARGLFPWLTLQAQLELARAYLALGDKKARTLLAEIRESLVLHPHLGVLEAQADVLASEVDAMPDAPNGTRVGLTAAELRLLPLLSTHLSFREIGEELFVSRNTIKTQAISVYRKLGVSSRSDAIDRAGALGLVGGLSRPA